MNDQDEQLSQQLAFLAGLVAARTTEFSVNRLEDLSLLILQGSARISANTVSSPSADRVRRSVLIMFRLSEVVPPLVSRLASRSTYLGMRTGLIILRRTQKALNAWMGI